MNRLLKLTELVEISLIREGIELDSDIAKIALDIARGAHKAFNELGVISVKVREKAANNIILSAKKEVEKGVKIK